MTLDELAERIESIRTHSEVDGFEQIRIVLEDPAVGARKTVGLRNLGLGIDDESGMIMLMTDTPIIRKPAEPRKRRQTKKELEQIYE